MHPGFSNVFVSLPLSISAKLINSLQIIDVFLRFYKKLYRSGYIRAVNYHDVPPNDFSSFEKQLRFFKNYFSSVSFSDLEKFFFSKIWSKSKPGLIISFDDGLRSHYSIVAPLLEKYGFTGWFFVPTDFISTPVDKQSAYCLSHNITFGYDYGDGRRAMTWNEIKDLDNKHVLVSHTRSHLRLGESVPEDRLKTEIIGSKKILEEKLGHDIMCFGWVGGEVDSYSATAYKWIQKAGYKFSFMTKAGPILPNTSTQNLHRIFLGSNWPLYIVKLHFSGVLDILYYKQRAKINRRTSL
jgi:peptidoglycan/xylan/chitin deacetylase (PgdA/CDA1 family)